MDELLVFGEREIWSFFMIGRIIEVMMGFCEYNKFIVVFKGFSIVYMLLSCL